MRFALQSNGDFISMTLLPDNPSEKHLLAAFGASTLPVVIIEPSSDGLKVTRRVTAPPTEDSGNTA